MYKISEADQEFINTFSSFVNGEMSSPVKVGIELANDHRYLVNKKAEVLFSFMEQLAEDFHEGHFDPRNKWACRLSAEAIDHLIECGLYHPANGYVKNQR